MCIRDRTDIAGLAMVVPPTRRVIAEAVRRWFERQIQTGRVQVYTQGYNDGPPRPPGVIDVEGEVVEVVENTDAQASNEHLEK